MNDLLALHFALISAYIRFHISYELMQIECSRFVYGQILKRWQIVFYSTWYFGFITFFSKHLNFSVLVCSWYSSTKWFQKQLMLNAYILCAAHQKRTANHQEKKRNRRRQWRKRKKEKKTTTINENYVRTWEAMVISVKQKSHQNSI